VGNGGFGFFVAIGGYRPARSNWRLGHLLAGESNVQWDNSMDKN
jgi:hypothetical protein